MGENRKRPHLKAPWKKGQSGNPKGRPKGTTNVIRQALRELTVETYREVIETVLKGNMAALQAIIDDPDTPVIQVGVAKAFMKAMKAGDYATIERIAERIVGKIPDEINLVSKNLNANVTMPTESAVTQDEIGTAFDAFDKEV